MGIRKATTPTVVSRSTCHKTREQFGKKPLHKLMKPGVLVGQFFHCSVFTRSHDTTMHCTLVCT